MRWGSRSHRSALIGIVVLLTLTGCASTVGPEPTITPDSSSTNASTPTPATASPPVPDVPSAPPPPATDTTSGCPANNVPVPSDAVLVTIGDIDRDGRADEQFYSESDAFSYGVRTASGATILLRDDLAGPGRHNGWTSIREKATVAVLDDSRTATLHAFVDCAFITTTDPQGKAYRFGLNGFSDFGTGVECTDRNGGALLYGVLAARRDDGLYDITRTHIVLEDEGRVARNGSHVEIVAEGLPADDKQVALAMRSTCGETPIVSTSGR